jgi:hypothetical protein
MRPVDRLLPTSTCVDVEDRSRDFDPRRASHTYASAPAAESAPF